MGPPPIRVGLIGGGVIGAGWAARFALAGHDVEVFDPDPALAARLERAVERGRAAWDALIGPERPPDGTVFPARSLQEALAGAEFVQESLPERLDLKIATLAEASRAVAADTVIASSTSGLLPSALQAEMTGPERFVVGHPFNPVYLLPLVEVCGGKQTSEETVRATIALYRSLGMHPLHVRKEIDGFIADRLLEALWREALHLVNDGVATTDEIDRAITYGPGLRWAVMGSFLSYRLAGGEAGMRHFMAQFGPALKLPWARFDGPELTDALIDRIVAQSDAQAEGASNAELERLRDACLVDILLALRRNDHGAGTAAIGAGRDH